MLLIASAEDCWIVRVSSLSKPMSPVALLPMERSQNQHVCSMILCWPTSVSTRFMWLILMRSASIEAAKLAVSSRMARTSVMALPSTSRSLRTMEIRWMPSSTPRKLGSEGEPLSVSSAMTNNWHNMSLKPMLTSPEYPNAVSDAAKFVTEQPSATTATAHFCQTCAPLGPLRSEHRQHRRQHLQRATKQQIPQSSKERMPPNAGRAKSHKPVR
mmetsp:Transcript_143433/g.357402  ORF Transcript_143433/g.357402 Transcript_143433/m.357402 type:complete len:214 (+) Transcript_143433:1321-1962(+)